MSPLVGSTSIRWKPESCAPSVASVCRTSHVDELVAPVLRVVHQREHQQHVARRGVIIEAHLVTATRDAKL